MKLSIIIPTYNIEDYIEECLDSIIHQLTDECQLIIIDDHSTDNTVPKIIEKINYNFEDEERYKLYINLKNEGVSSSRNKGIDIAKGEYIAFIDGDDIIEPNYIKNALEAIKKGKDYYKLSWIMFGLENGTYLAKHLPDWNCSVWSRIFKKNIIRHKFDIEMKIAEDKKFLQENITDDLKVGYIDEPIYKYRSGRIGGLTNLYNK